MGESAPLPEPETASPQRRPWGRKALRLTAFTFAVLTAWLTVDFLWTRHRLEQDAFGAARARASQAAAAIDKSFQEAKGLAEAIVRDLSTGALPYGDIETRMRKDCESRSDVDGIAITFQPFAWTPEQRLYQEYVFRKPDGQFGILKGATYDYSQAPTSDPKGPKTAWYHTPLKKGPTWNEPFLATGAGKVLIEYGAPFTAPKDPAKTAGVVTVDFSLEDLQSILMRLDLGSTGYGMVFTDKGTFLAHPDRTEIVHGSALRDRGLADPLLQAEIKRVLGGASCGVDYPDPLTGLDVWMLFEPVPAAGSALVLVIQKDEFTNAPERSLQRLVAIALSAAAAVLSLVMLAVRLEQGSTHALWIGSGAFSLGCVGLIVLTWGLAWDVERVPGTAVTSKIAVEKTLDRYRLSMTRAEPYFAIPTGVQLTALKFPDAGSVTLGGYIWQRYADSLPKEIARGFLLPHHVSDQYVQQEVERVRQGTEEVVVWKVVFTIQQSYNPRLFPFDRRNVALLLQPAELNANVVLVPDLAAYPVLTPRALPGVAKDFRVSNWRFQESFFSYQTGATASTIGLATQAGRPAAPILYFNLVARRYFVGPFIAYLLPAIVAAGLTFAFLMTRRQGAGGTEDLLTGLSYIAALFFVIVVAHTALRDHAGAVNITYLEHLFIVLYVIVGLVVLDAFLVARLPEAWWVRFRHHLPARLVFWPLITGTLLVSTLAVFVFA